MDPENDGWFEVTPRIDYAAAARAKWIEDNPEEAKQPGLVLAVALERNGASEEFVNADNQESEYEMPGPR